MRQRPYASDLGIRQVVDQQFGNRHPVGTRGNRPTRFDVSQPPPEEPLRNLALFRS